MFYTHDYVLADPVDCHPSKAVEFAFAVAIVTEFFQEVTGRVKHLDAMIGTVRHLRRTKQRDKNN